MPKTFFPGKPEEVLLATDRKEVGYNPMCLFEEWAWPGIPDETPLFDEEEDEEESVTEVCWIAHCPDGWLQRCQAAEENQPIPHAGRLAYVDPQEVHAVMCAASEKSQEECEVEEEERLEAELEDKPPFGPLFNALYEEMVCTLFFALPPGHDQARINFVFQEETELLKERLARRIAERDADQAYAVRASFAALEQAISRLERTLGVEAATTPTTAKAIPNLPHPVASLPIYFSERSKEWWDDLATALRAEKHKLAHEMPLLKVRVGKIAEKLTRKGLALLTKVRDLLPSLRLLDQERAAQLLEQLRESDHTEIARALHHEWLGPTKVKLLARTRRGPPLPPPRPIRELLDEALTSLEQADQSLEIEREQLATMQALWPRVEAALSHITGEAPQPSINA